jgi:hypothetical protein
MGNALIIFIVLVVDSALAYIIGYMSHKKTDLTEKLNLQRNGYHIGYTAGYIDATANKLAQVKIQNRLEEQNNGEF